MFYIFNEKGFFLFESDKDFYINKTTIAPPFERYPKEKFDYKFNKKTEKWISIEKKN